MADTRHPGLWYCPECATAAITREDALAHVAKEHPGRDIEVIAPGGTLGDDEVLATLATLFEGSVQQAIADGKHATCRYDPVAIADLAPGVSTNVCGWTGAASDLVRHATGMYQCPNGHGGNWLAFHAEGDPAEPLPPRWEWSCDACDWSGDADHPVTRCMNCGASLARETEDAPAPDLPWSESVGMNLPGWTTIVLVVAVVIAAVVIVWWSRG